MSTAPPDAHAAAGVLRSALSAAQHTTAHVTFDELRRICSDAVATIARDSQPVEAKTVDATVSERASVLAAYLVYCYLKRNHRWSPTADRRERLYSVMGLLDTLDSLLQ